MKSLEHRSQFKQSSDYLRKVRFRYVRALSTLLIDDWVTLKEKNQIVEAMAKRMVSRGLYAMPPKYDPAIHKAPRATMQAIGHHLYKIWKVRVETEIQQARIRGDRPRFFNTGWWPFCHHVGWVPYCGQFQEVKEAKLG